MQEVVSAKKPRKEPPASGTGKAASKGKAKAAPSAPRGSNAKDGGEASASEPEIDLGVEDLHAEISATANGKGPAAGSKRPAVAPKKREKTDAQWGKQVDQVG